MSVAAADVLTGDQPADPAARSVDAAAARAKRRIILYAMNYAPEVVGVGKYTGEIAEHLSASGFDVTVVTTPPHYPEWKVRSGFRNAYSHCRQGDIRVFRTPLFLRVPMRGIWRLLAPLSFALTSAPVIVWQILRRRPDTVCCIEPTLLAAPVAQLAARLVGARTILHVQDLEVEQAFAVGHLTRSAWLKRLGSAFEQVTRRSFDSIITISHRMAGKLRFSGIAGDRLSVIRNWVDLDHIFPLQDVSPYRAELGLTREDFVVLYAGTIGAKQELDVLLRAAERLEGDSRVHFVIAGEGPLKAELQMRYRHLTHVQFLPFQPYARLNELLNMPDLHLLPQARSTADLNLPSKLGGMLASGKPILVTAEAETELADFLEGSSLFVPPGDAEALAAAILSLRGKPPGSRETAFRLAHALSKTKALEALAEAFVR